MRRLTVGLLAGIVLAACSSGGGSSGAVPSDRPAPARPAGYYRTPIDRGYDVTHYDIGLTYRPKPGTIDGGTNVTATATRRLERFTLDLHGLRVTRVQVGSRRDPVGGWRDFDVTAIAWW